jgi:PadR family transcriptional regulator PadR
MPDPVDVQALGRTIHEVLILAVLRTGPRHGYQIALDVEEETGGAFTFQHGTLYPILHRLEAAGRIRGRWDRSGGRRRKEYALTPEGRAHLRDATSLVEGAFGALIGLVGGAA